MDRFNYNKAYLKMFMFVILLLYSFLMIGFGHVLIGTQSNLGIILLLFGLLPWTLFFKWEADIRLIFAAALLLVLAKVFYLINLNPITGPDAVRYYQQVLQYVDFGYFLDMFMLELKNNFLLASAYPSFGLAYIPFFKIFNSTSVEIIVVFNTIFIILTAYVFSKVLKKYGEKIGLNKGAALIICTIFPLISPALSYWSSTFSKDIFTQFVTVLCLYLLLKKRFVFFVLLMIYATMLRDYSIAIVIIYYCLLKQMNKSLFFILLGSFGLVLYNVGFAGIYNVGVSFGYLLLAPNPLDLTNWNSFFAIEAEILVVFVLGVLMSVYVFIRDKDSRKFYIGILTSLLIYSCIMTLVGSIAVSNQGGEYGAGMVGDNVSRKKLPIILILFMVTAYTYKRLTIRVKSRNKVKSMQLNTVNTRIQEIPPNQ